MEEDKDKNATSEEEEEVEDNRIGEDSEGDGEESVDGSGEESVGEESEDEEERDEENEEESSGDGEEMADGNGEESARSGEESSGDGEEMADGNGEESARSGEETAEESKEEEERDEENGEESEGEESEDEEERDDENGVESSGDGEEMADENGEESVSSGEETAEESKEDEERDEENREESEGEEKEEDDAMAMNEDEDTDGDTDGEDGPCALEPVGMWFKPSEYINKTKIATRCYIRKTLEFFKSLRHPLTAYEDEWFKKHPQFKHIFHMPMSRTHMSKGMWMLLLRTAKVNSTKEAWFVVNGSPVRYSLREHALISGLSCKHYPSPDYETAAGSDRFWKTHFRRGSRVVRPKDVEEALERMVPDRSNDRLRMLVLYFIVNVIDGQTKTGEDATPVKPFVLRAVDNLAFCRSFPWGRWSFEHVLREIDHTVRHFDRKAKDTEKDKAMDTIWTIPGFVIPLELLAFEAIPELSSNCRVEHPAANLDCPRMCRTKFKQPNATGYSLGQINHFLGETKDIDSILITHCDREERMLLSITEEDEDFRNDYVVDSWMQRLRAGFSIFFPSMFDSDVEGRLGNTPGTGEARTTETVEARTVEDNGSSNDLAEIVKSMQEGMKSMQEEMKSMQEQIKRLNEKVSSLEQAASSQPQEVGKDDLVVVTSSQQQVGAASSQPANEKKGGKRLLSEYNPTPPLTRAKAKRRV